MHKLVISSALLLTVPLLAACNTVSGVGKDVSALGKGVTHMADEVSDEFFPAPRRNTVRTVYVQPQRRGVASAGQPCDPYSGELSGGSLPPCRTQTVQPRALRY